MSIKIWIAGLHNPFRVGPRNSSTQGWPPHVGQPWAVLHNPFGVTCRRIAHGHLAIQLHRITNDSVGHISLDHFTSGKPGAVGLQPAARRRIKPIESQAQVLLRALG